MDDDTDVRTIISEAHVVEVEGTPTPIKRAVKAAESANWHRQGPYLAESVVRGEVYKSGAREGERRPDSRIEQYWVDLLSPQRNAVIRVSCEVVNGTARPAVRRYWQRGGQYNVPLSDNSMRSILND